MGIRHQSVRVKGHSQRTQVGVIADRRYNMYGCPGGVRHLVGVGAKHRVRAVVRRIVRQVVVTAAGHHDVNPAEQRCEFDVVRDALQVRDEDNLVHPSRLQGGHLGLNGADNVRVDGRRAGASDANEARRDGADDADVFAVSLHHRAWQDAACVDQGLERRHVLKAEVAAEEGRLRSGERRNERSEHVRTEVKLVVADGQRVVVEHGQGDGVVGRARRLGALVEPKPEDGPGEHVVAAAHEHRRKARSLGRRPLGAEHRSEVVDVAEGRLPVVVVQQHEGEVPRRFLFCIRCERCGIFRHRQGRRCGGDIPRNRVQTEGRCEDIAVRV